MLGALRTPPNFNNEDTYLPNGLQRAYRFPNATSVAAEPASAALDRLFATAWAREKTQPVALADDPEFVRRIYLDLIGRIPTGDTVSCSIS